MYCLKVGLLVRFVTRSAARAAGGSGGRLNTASRGRDNKVHAGAASSMAPLAEPEKIIWSGGDRRAQSSTRRGRGAIPGRRRFGVEPAGGSRRAKEKDEQAQLAR